MVVPIPKLEDEDEGSAVSTTWKGAPTMLVFAVVKPCIIDLCQLSDEKTFKMLNCFAKIIITSILFCLLFQGCDIYVCFIYTSIQ